MAKVQLTIDREFRDLCPSSSEDELMLLRASIKADGCRDPIVCWSNGGNLILDGHQRHTICQQEKKPFDTKGIKLPDREAAKQWILRNQLARRNLTEVQRKILRGRLYNSLKGEQGGDHKSNRQNDGLIGAAESVAEEFGCSTRTAERSGELAISIDAIDETTPEVAEAIEQGEIPVSAAAPLAALPKRKRQRAANKIKEGASVKEALAAVTEPAQEDAVCDSNGTELPKHLHPIFVSDKFKKALNFAKQLKAAINDIASDEIVGQCLSAKGIAGQACRDLDNVRNALRFAAPYALCPYCRCKTKAKPCEACTGRGWVGENVYKSAPPEMRV